MPNLISVSPLRYGMHFHASPRGQSWRVRSLVLRRRLLMKSRRFQRGKGEGQLQQGRIFSRALSPRNAPRISESKQSADDPNFNFPNILSPRVLKPATQETRVLPPLPLSPRSIFDRWRKKSRRTGRSMSSRFPLDVEAPVCMWGPEGKALDIA